MLLVYDFLASAWLDGPISNTNNINNLRTDPHPHFENHYIAETQLAAKLIQRCFIKDILQVL